MIILLVRTIYSEFGRCTFLLAYDVLCHAQVFTAVILFDVCNHQIATVYDSHPKQTHNVSDDLKTAVKVYTNTEKKYLHNM